ncbi:hypothetical protein I302_105085 [Kwoniella bestiolae CBS 10118]|uniref:Transcription factor domain-containing protein n=1 Tax=Kwoniella bestiolae CBS 10118 TaxID=1296100 RepID=A0AAJ8M8S1_9TREE
MAEFNYDGILQNSPQPILQRLDSDIEMSDQGKKRKRLSLQETPSADPSVLSDKGKQRAVTMGPLRASPEQQDSGGENNRKGKGKASSSGLAGFTSCEACRKGKRFAIDCVRVKAVRRKGPAPVAVSDAVHGYSHGSALIGPDTARRSSAFSELESTEFERKLSASSLPEGIDQVVPGPTIDNVLNLFFDYVTRRDRTDPVFFALALTVIASTLVQVPRSLVNLDKTEVEDLARKCIKIARAKMAHMWEDPIPITISMGIVHLVLGNNTAHVVVTAQANQLALALRLNEESRARTICLPLQDAHDLLLPAEVDDEMITGDGILPQPPGTTSLITGFNVNTNLFRILNDTILIQRRKSPRMMEEILADLQQLQELRNRTIHTYLTVPDPLKLRNAYDSRSASPAVDWEAKLQARFLDFFNKAGDNGHALNSYLVMQGNILVTQHVVRLVLLQTRQALLAQLALFTPILPSPMGPEESAEDIACELLDGLNRQKLLMQFLSVLSVIEGMYTFGKDISAE